MTDIAGIPAEDRDLLTYPSKILVADRLSYKAEKVSSCLSSRNDNHCYYMKKIVSCPGARLISKVNHFERLQISGHGMYVAIQGENN